ncbi:hypothetical protein [Haloplanus salilacus]|uniref:hypothetical protein n=1 Tax=Haloplanus salilacus TaxID=2949994 RepID=UPI0030CCC5B1
MDTPDVAGTDPPSDRADVSGPFFDWYHHAVALAYSVSAAVSAGSMPLDRLALYFLASLVGAYLVVAVLTVLWRRLLPRLL